MLYDFRSLTSEFDVVFGRARFGQKQEQAKSRTNACMGPERSDINPLMRAVRAQGPRLLRPPEPAAVAAIPSWDTKRLLKLIGRLRKPNSWPSVPESMSPADVNAQPTFNGAEVVVALVQATDPLHHRSS